MPEPWEQTELRTLVGHREFVDSDTTMEQVHKCFGGHSRDFMAVVEAGRVIGVCSRHEVGMRLGARYGFSLFYRKPVCDFLSPSVLLVVVGQPLRDVLESVFSREEERFYDDVVLVETDGSFVGLIHVHTLVRLQTDVLRENIFVLERQKELIREKNQQMEEELTMAREMQFAFLPREEMVFLHEDEPWLKVSRTYQPAQKVGGDFMHVMALGQDSVGIFIADVMGHGVRSALVTAMLRALVEEIGVLRRDPGEFLTELNRELTAILSQTGDLMFATAFYLVVDRQTGKTRYSRAGHPCPLVLRRKLGIAEVLECRKPFAGPGLCVFEGARYGTAEAALDEDDVVLMFTDGLIEASVEGGEPFGVEGVSESLLKHAGLGLNGLVEGVVRDAAEFVQGTPFEDDLCVVGVNFAMSCAPRSVGLSGDLLGSR